MTPLHPLLQELRGAGGPKVHELTVAEARAQDSTPPALADPPEPVPVVADRMLPDGTRVRIYAHGGSDPAPCLVYFFGGGFVLGSLDTIDPTCRRFANAASCTVVSVGYPRAPEQPFPAAVETCYAATRWVADHAAELGVDARRLAVGGTSAGGNLAAVVALLARDRGASALRAQVLVYPVCDRLPDTPSVREYAVDDDFLDARGMAWFWSHYLPDDADVSPLAAPLRAGDVSGLPPAVVITAEHDPLRDEAEQYAARLADAGVRVDLARYDGMVHGFFSMSRLEASQAALALAAAALRREWA